VLKDEKATTAIGFLRRAISFYRHHEVAVERVMTDNGSAYRSAVHAIACRTLGIRHLKTRPTDRRPTARPRVSSARCSPAGPTAAPSIAARPSVLPPSSAGYGVTTSSVDTAPWAEGRPELGSPS
jgi:Integrase core domain